MVRLNNFKHDKRKVKEKYEFFADSIENTTGIIGKTPHHPIENHLSILEKIKFQFENNLEEYQGKYIKNHLSNRLFSREDIYLNSPTSKRLNNFLESKSNKTEFKKKLSTEISYQKKNLLKNYMHEVFQIIADDSIGSKGARKMLEYYSNLIVSEYLFEGFTRKDIYHIPTLIITGETYQDSRPECFIKKCNWRTKGLKHQLQRFFKLCYSKKLVLQYTFRIKNLICEKDFHYEYNGVTIVGSQSKILRKIIPKSYQEEFLDYNGAFVFQTIETNSVFTGFDKFTANVNNALDYFNTVYSGHSYIDLNKYHIFSVNKSVGRKTWKNLNTILSERKMEIKQDFTDLEATFSVKKKTKRVQIMIELDQIYYKARQEPNLKEKTIYYWRYLESLFTYQAKDFPKEREKAEFIIKRISRILITDEYDTFYRIVIVGLLNIIVNYSSELNISSFEAQKRFLIGNRTLDFEKFKEFKAAKNHLFVSREISKINNYKKNSEFAKAYQYYTSTLRESYELRNFSVHYGKTFEKTVIKAGLNLEIIVTRLRRILIESLKKEEFKRVKLKTIIEGLSKEGLSMLNKK